MKRSQTAIVFLLLFAGACVEPFYPPQESSGFLGYLGIDGYLDGNGGTARVKLSRSVELHDYRPSPGETEASVSIEAEDGGSVTLKEGHNGLYVADHLTFDPGAKYRLNIITKNGSSYTSDYIAMKQSPEFDSVVWRADGDKGIRFYVNGHDNSGNTKYYLYRFTETWAYGVPFVSHYKNIDGLPVKRKKTELVADCWDERASTEVLVKSTTGLSRDLVSMFPIHFIARGARILEDTYSINVEQRAISANEFQFWQQVKKTNESLGGLFDPIPSQVVGNVRCLDHSEPVLGYFTGGFSKQLRIFVHLDDLPKNLQALDALSYDCTVYDFSLTSGESIGPQIYLDLHVPPSVWYVTSANCGDCRNLGGDTIRPKYWPQ